MTYKQAYDYIEECASLGISPGLESIRELCSRLGNPQDELRFIHIAGTNGKGSVAAYMSSILKCSGLKVGRYISPTISDYLERFSIGGRSMSRKDFASYIERVRPVCDEMTAEGLPHPTPFEIETAIAFLYFKEKNCDITVLECGMGGRLDATNIVRNKLLTVFAHIDTDHTAYLGDTIEKIAGEKAGIICGGVPVVTGPQYPEVMKVLEDAAAEHDTTVSLVTDEGTAEAGDRPGDRPDAARIADIRCNLKGGSFTLACGNDKRKWHTPLLGTHQIYNAAVALRAIQILKDVASEHAGTAYKVVLSPKLKDILSSGLGDAVIQKGLDAAEWPARLQILSRRPMTVIDGAHNPDAARRLKESLDLLIPERPRILIMGMLKDKDVDAVAKIMCRDAVMVLTVMPPDNPRAMRSADLARIVNGYNPSVTSLDSVEEAVEAAGLLAKGYDNSVIIAFGSLSYMGRMLDIYKKRNGKR